jgi:hypothetical protein
MADLGEIGVTYPALEPPQRAALGSVLESGSRSPIP